MLDEAAVSRIVASRPAEPPIDLHAFADLTGGDQEFARELAQTFLQTSDEILAELGHAAGQGNRGGVARAAHSLKGASANIHARPLKSLCAELESRGGELTDTELLQQIAKVASERQRVVAALQSFAEGAHKAAGGL